MTQEITNEIRAKIILLYVGSPFKLITNIEGNPVIETLTPIAACDWIEDLSNQYADYFPSDKRSQLILKPLSLISDEDLFSIAEIALFENNDEWRDADNWEITKEIDHFIVKICNREEFVIYYDGTLFSQVGKSFGENIDTLKALDIYDKLRSKSYMLPAYGIPDLFAVGLAIEENLKTK